MLSPSPWARQSAHTSSLISTDSDEQGTHGISKDKLYWWENDPQERFWIEIVARPELGDRLLAPYDQGAMAKTCPSTPQ